MNKDHRQDACATEVLAGLEYFDCGPLQARISARACLLNQGKVKGFDVSGRQFFGRLIHCLACALGKEMRAYPPGVILAPAEQGKAPSPQSSPQGSGDKSEVQAGTPAPTDAVRPRRAKKPPA